MMSQSENRSVNLVRTMQFSSTEITRKKVLGDQLTFVLDGTQGVEVVAGVTAEAALAALASMR